MLKVKSSNYFLSDGTIGLRLLEKEDIKGGYLNWLNDGDTNSGNSHFRFPVSSSDLEAYIESALGNNSLLALGVFDISQEDVHVGNISIQNISWIDGTGEIAFILGEKAFRGKGVMYRAANLIINHAFQSLNLSRISCGTLENNIGMLKLAGKLGMKLEGCRRSAVYKNGIYLDVHEFGVLRSEWESVENRQ